MSFFKRLTSVFLCCVLLSFPVYAADVDGQDYYTLEAVEDGRVSILSSAVSYASAGWSSTDSGMLEGIYKFIQYLTVAPSSIMKGSLFSYLVHIASDTESILNNLGGVDGIATETTLSSFKDYFTSFEFVDSPYSTLTGWNGLLGTVFDMRKAYNYTDKDSFPYTYQGYDVDASKYRTYHYSFSDVMGMLVGFFSSDTQISAWNYAWTPYHYIRRLSDVLANDDDKSIRSKQKINQSAVKDEFLSGSSSGSSLGKDDFGSLSSVGGTFKDTISLNGQSSISDLSSGLSDADTVGQGWFSRATKDSLDAVSGSSESTISTFSDDGLYSVDADPDPYHMQGFEDNYAWLWGDD